MARQLMELCGKGGFKLTKFTSNDREVLAKIPEERRASKFVNLDFEEFPTERALGVKWNIESDAFGFSLADINKPNTMRGVLSTISAVFDPLNFVCPVILTGKQIMQELWRRKLAWDQPLEGEILQKWLKWKANLSLLSLVAIPRCYFTPPQEEVICIGLHHFCDASEIGYGTASYLRIVYESGRIETSFVMGKSRNTPIKTVSIPRLELQSAVLATRIDHTIRKELELDIAQVIFWTDSMITLNYIRNETRRFQTYVANRITEIREHSEPRQWRHCPGKINPADDASRGMDISSFVQQKRWFNGPDFLLKTEEHWPETSFQEIPVEQLEVKKEIYATKLEPASAIDELINRSSSWIGTLRKVAWLLKFVDWIKNRSLQKNVEKAPEVQKRICQDDIERAKKRVAAIVQRKTYPNEVKYLSEGNRVKASSEIVRLKPVMKGDRVVRVGGRISIAPISEDTMNPMILPKEHHITKILIRHIHQSNGHCGVEQTLCIY